MPSQIPNIAALLRVAEAARARIDHALCTARGWAEDEAWHALREVEYNRLLREEADAVQALAAAPTVTVDEVARAMYESAMREWGRDISWDDEREPVRRGYRRDADAALRALGWEADA